MQRILKMAIILFIINGTIFAQHAVEHTSLEWIMGIKDSMTFRNKELTFGFQMGYSSINIFNVSKFENRTNLCELKLGYEDIYSLYNNNPHNFVNYFGAQLYGGFSHKPQETNLLSIEGFRFGFRLIRGIGYNFNNTFVIPYFVRGIDQQHFDINKNELSVDYNSTYTPEEKLYAGTHREAGVMVQFSNGFGVSLALNNNLYSKRTSMLPSLGSDTIEYTFVYGVSRGVYYLFGDSELFPIYDFIARSAVSFAFVSLKRAEAYFPLGGKHEFSMNSVKLGFNYRINLGL